MLKQVVLPAPFGPISASSSPASTAKVTPSTALTPPKDLSSPCASRTGPLIAPPRPARRRSGALTPIQRAADEALRESQHQHDDRAAQHEAPILGNGAHQPVLQPVQRRRRRRSARSRSARRRAAPSAARRPISGSPCRSGTRCPWRRRRARRQCRRDAPAMMKASQLMRSTSRPMASARTGLSRPARRA